MRFVTSVVVVSPSSAVVDVRRHSLIMKVLDALVESKDTNCNNHYDGNRGDDSQKPKRFVYVRFFCGCCSRVACWWIGFVCRWIKSFSGRWKFFSRRRHNGCWLWRVNSWRLGAIWSESLSWCVSLQGGCLLSSWLGCVCTICWLGIISCGGRACWWASPMLQLPWPAPL